MSAPNERLAVELAVAARGATRYGLNIYTTEAIILLLQRASAALSQQNAMGKAERREIIARTLYTMDRDGWLEKYPDDSFIEWDESQFEAFKDRWRNKADQILAALSRTGEA